MPGMTANGAAASFGSARGGSADIGGGGSSRASPAALANWAGGGAPGAASLSKSRANSSAAVNGAHVNGSGANGTSHHHHGGSSAAGAGAQSSGRPPAPPLSSLVSTPLLLSTVERKGQPTAVRERPRTVAGAAPTRARERPRQRPRVHDLEEAPTYCPTEEEWADPFEFIRRISPEASQYGICKIIPPESWNPPFAIDTEKFHFRTRKQELNSVEGSTRANLTYLDALAKFHKQQGTNLSRLPYVDKKPLDLYRLKKAVEAIGGFEKVCKLKKWAEIGRELGYSGKIMSSLSTSLKNSYARWLWPYEEFLRLAKPGVQQQLEHEYGGPFTPSPAPSPMKRVGSNTNTPGGESPAQRASDALQGSLNGHVDKDKDHVMTDAPNGSSGHASANGNARVASPAGFPSMSRTSAETRSFTPTRQFGSPLGSSKNTPELRPSALGNADSLKRQLSFDSIDSGRPENAGDKEEGENGSRRSKRLKKENVPTVAGSHMTLFRPSAPRVPRDENYVPGERCESCGKGEEIGFLALCEHCDNAYHGVCLDPPLRQKPDPEWNCPRCLVGDTQFGFEEGGLYSLKQFQEKANEFKQSYFENRLPWDPVLQCPRPVTEDDVEREFWRLVASLEETVEVEYGADIHCTTHGSGFPTAEKNPLDPYSRDPWNLNLLPLHQDSLFRHIKSDISGMTVPWVYVGMTFSTFCWHTEDHYAYSANYQHFGDTKTWYGIPSADAEKFEAAMREAVPELFEAQPDLLFQLVTLLPPEQLKKSGVRVYALDQRAGQFVITFPQAYHAGFNHGFNFNEAVNFAPSDWEPFGLDGVDRLQQFRKQPCFSHDELLWTAAEGTSTSTLTIANARWLAPALKRIHDREKSRRKAFIREHIEAERHDCPLHQADSDQRVEIKTERTEDGSAEGAPPTQPKESAPAVKVACPLRFEVDDRDVPEEEYQCTYCKAYAYLTRFKCLASGKVLCLLDAGNFQCCEQARNQRFSGANHVLVYRKSEEAMDAMYQKVAEKARQPEAWEEKFEKLLEEEARPSLKALRSLLNEGEKIPWHLPSLAELRQYVDRCQEWVDEASNYIVRKPHARRKNERSHARKSVGNIQQAVEDREQRFDYMNRLVEQGVQLGFESPEIGQLRERVEAARDFQRKAVVILENKVKPGIEEVEELLDIGRGFNVEFLETELLAHRLDQMKWDRRAREARGTFLTLKEASDLLEEAQRLVIPPYNEHLKFWQEKVEQGRSWEAKASELTSADSIHYAQLEALSNRAKEFLLPVKPETRDAVELILQRQREAQRQILELLERSKSEDYRKRPTYQEVCEMMKRLESINSKPNGTIDLDRELKRHEDWMRRGKKLFGKTNAPLHILKSHMEYVLERNQDCLDIEHDKPRHPAEPQSREPSPGDYKKMKSWEDPRNREVFCICRKQEAGMMIECELCHEWYHGKCLKIARGKVKEDDKFTCPVCDWRVKIPRDAARPKLEDLQLLYDEIPHLPFQADEEEVLKAIIDNAQEFRNVVSPLCDSALSTPEEAETQRFYLRKIEGAEVLLTRETNFFRQELHKWCPVAPEPPPLLEVSKSTRKPRPTKLQKMFNEHGVSSIEELPEHLISKAKSLHRKMLNAAAAERDREKLSALREQEMNGGGAMAYALNSSVAQSSRPGDSLHNSSRDGSSRGASITSPAAVDNNAFLGHDGGRRRSTSPLGSGFSHRPSGGAAAAAPGGAGGSAVQTPQQQQHQGHSRTSSGGGISRSGRNKDGGDSSAAGGRSKYDDDEGGGRGLSPMSEDDPLDYDSSWGGPLGSYGDRHRQGSHGYSGGYGSHDEPAARGLTAGSDSFGRHDPVLGGTAGNRRSSDAVAVGDDPAAAAADEEAAAAGQGSIFQELIQDGARYGEDDDDGVGGTVKPDDVFMLDTVED